MLAYISFVLVGLAGLHYGTERFVDGTVASGRHLKLSSVVVGTILLSAATSFPEMVTSAKAALAGHPAIGVGNAVGSNITNVLLVAGFMLLLDRGPSQGKSSAAALGIMLLASVAACLVMLDLSATRLEGFLLLAGGAAFMLVMLLFPEKFVVNDEASAGAGDISAAKAAGLLLLGLALIFASVEALLHGAVNLARLLGVSDLVTGLTVIAIGTSLPELAAVASCVRRGRADLALATVIGSNILNLLGVMGLCLAVHPAAMPHLLLWRDLPVMLCTTAILAWLAWVPGGRRGRLACGAILLAGFAGYQLALYFSEMQ